MDDYRPHAPCAGCGVALPVSLDTELEVADGIAEVRCLKCRANDLGKGAYYASLPHDKNGELLPGHTTWEMKGPKGQDRWRRVAGAIAETLA